MSMGAFTILRMVGSEPDLRTIASHCAQSPEFICDVLRTANPPLLRADAPATENSRLADSRIKAVVLAAPGYGFTLVPHGLDRVRVPIQLWSGESDTKVPYQTNAGLIRAALGTSVDFHSVPGAGHFSFLVPVRPSGATGYLQRPGPIRQERLSRADERERDCLL
jgi:predicted dienelactone hydrolase